MEGWITKDATDESITCSQHQGEEMREEEVHVAVVVAGGALSSSSACFLEHLNLARADFQIQSRVDFAWREGRSQNLMTSRQELSIPYDGQTLSTNHQRRHHFFNFPSFGFSICYQSSIIHLTIPIVVGIEY